MYVIQYNQSIIYFKYLVFFLHTKTYNIRNNENEDIIYKQYSCCRSFVHNQYGGYQRLKNKYNY